MVCWGGLSISDFLRRVYNLPTACYISHGKTSVWWHFPMTTVCQAYSFKCTHVRLCLLSACNIWRCVLSIAHFIYDDCENNVLYLIIIVKLEIWITNHCWWLGKETVVCCVYICTFSCSCHMLWIFFPYFKHRYFIKERYSWQVTVQIWFDRFPTQER